MYAYMESTATAVRSRRKLKLLKASVYKEMQIRHERRGSDGITWCSPEWTGRIGNKRMNIYTWFIRLTVSVSVTIFETNVKFQKCVYLFFIVYATGCRYESSFTHGVILLPDIISSSPRFYASKQHTDYFWNSDWISENSTR